MQRTTARTQIIWAQIHAVALCYHGGRCDKPHGACKIVYLRRGCCGGGRAVGLRRDRRGLAGRRGGPAAATVGGGRAQALLQRAALGLRAAQRRARLLCQAHGRLLMSAIARLSFKGYEVVSEVACSSSNDSPCDSCPIHEWVYSPAITCGIVVKQRSH